jgi:hypothetical protein
MYDASNVSFLIYAKGLKVITKPGVVAHTGNPSHSRSRDRRI